MLINQIDYKLLPIYSRHSHDKSNLLIHHDHRDIVICIAFTTLNKRIVSYLC